jgi:LacI family transcriptional regulator
MVCAFCQRTEGQAKAGLNKGVQRYKCAYCRRRYLAETRPRGYPDEVRRAALSLYAQGIKIREIGRRLEVNHQTVINWIRTPSDDSGAGEPRVSSPAPVPVPEMDFEDEVATTEAADLNGYKKRTTISDVARRAGVSTATVSNYLNQKGHMGPETRDRIEEAVAALHFTPSALIRAIRHRRTRILGVLLFGLGNLDIDVGLSLSPPLLAGINTAAAAAGYNVLLYPGWQYGTPSHAGLPFLDGHIDGLLWIAPDLREPDLERATAAGLPLAAALTRHVPAGVGYVNADNLLGMRLLVEHLAGFGHEHIAYVGPTHQSNFLDRRDGYRLALEAVGLPLRPELNVRGDSAVWESASYARVLDRWLSLPSPPTALLLPNDGLAQVMIQMLHDRGLRVPEDISVAGFDDIPSAELIGGGLTTIRQPFRAIGEVGIQRLLALIEGAPVEECRVILPTELIVRATTGPVRRTGLRLS